VKPIVSLFNKDVIETNAEAVGFVFPLHGMTIPIPVKKFIERIELKSAQYTFAVATRAGTKCMAFTKINKILKRKGKRLDAHFSLNMASNDPKFKDYDAPTQEKITEIERNIQNQLDSIEPIISNKEVCQEKDSKIIHPSNWVLNQLVLLGMKYAEYDGAKDYFYYDSKCIGCGICAKVCPSQKIKIIDRKPIWQKDTNCYFCYACINYCPKQAAQIKTKWYMKSYTDKTGRYPHPYATVNDIAEQK